MRPARHLVVFVKAPRLGAVKTRLAADIGALAAWRFYRESTARILRRLGADPRWSCRLGVTPDRFARGGHFWPARLPRLAQGTGDLGQRFSHAFRVLPTGPVVIVGTDIPDLAAAHIERAFRALERHHMVFGPSPDGGYWLIGARRRRLPRDAFHGVRWSSEHALADTLTNLGPRVKVGFLEDLADIDDGADYRRWKDGAQVMDS